MAKLDLASSEWCQLIFEGKNQAYGDIECVPIRQSDTCCNVDCGDYSSSWI